MLSNIKKMMSLLGIVFFLISINYLQAVRGNEKIFCCIPDINEKERLSSLNPSDDNNSFIEITGGWALHILLVARNSSEELPWEYWINSSCLFRKPNDDNNWRFNQYENGTGITLHLHTVLFLLAVGTFTVEANAGDVRAIAQGTFFRCGRFVEWWFVQNNTILSFN